MKKIPLMIVMVVMASSTIYGSDKVEKEPYFLFARKYDAHWTKPRVYARQVLEKGEPIPVGYVVSPRWKGIGGPLVEKKIVSGRNEYYNQFIEGYEPVNEFTSRMKQAKEGGSVSRRAGLENRYLLQVEKERKNMPTLAKEPGYLMRALNWLKAWRVGSAKVEAPLFTPIRQIPVQDISSSIDTVTEDKTRE